jgi:uncharacterized protein
MKLDQSFEVSAPLQRVWEALIDVERVAPCLPGASVTGHNDDGSYNGEFKVKIGPTSAAYSGKLNMEWVDEDSHHTMIEAAGTDKRGQGGAKATIESSVEKIDAGTTQVNVSTDYHITGRLARFGRGGMIEEISNRLLREFATNLQTMLAGDGTDAAETSETPGATPQPEDGAGTGAADPDASPAEVDAAAAEPPVPQAGSQGEPGDPAHATEATHEANAAGPARNADADPDDDPFAPPMPAPPPSGTAAGNAPPPPATPTPPPGPDENEPLDGLSLVGGAVFGQIKRNAISIAGSIAASLLVLGLLRRILRRRG